MASLDQLLTEASTAMAQTKSAGIAVQANTAALETSAATQQELLRSNASAVELITRTLGLGTLRQEQSNNQAALNVGADPEDLMGRQLADAQLLISAQDERARAQERIQAKTSVGFFDNPIDWLVNQFTVNDDINAYNAANEKAGLVEANITERAKFVDAQYQNNLRTKQTVTAASVEASAVQAKNLALVEAEKARQQGILYNTQGVKELQSLSVQQMQIAASVVDATTKQQQVQIALDHLALSREEFDWKKLEKSKGDKVSQFVVDTINRGLEVLDPSEPKLDINSPKALALISGKIPLDGKLKRAYDLGELNSRVDPSGMRTSRFLGRSPSDTLETLAFRPALAPDQKAAMNLLEAAASEIKDSAKYKQLEAAKDVEGMRRLLNSGVQQKFNDAASLVNSQDNPYQLPPIEQILQQTPTLAQLPFVQKILAPAIAGKIPLKDPSAVYNLGIAAVRAGEIPLNQFAVDLATMYKHAQRLNIESKQILGMGISPLESYTVKLSTSSFVDPKVNLADPNAIRRQISVDLAAIATAGIGGFN